MNYTVLYMGESKEAYYNEAFSEYRKRMNSYGTLNAVALKPAKTPGRSLSDEEIALTLSKEAAEFEKQLSLPKFQRSYKIALCIEGNQFSSEELAFRIDKIALSGKNSIVFLIGSSWGLHPSVKDRCDLKLSFSKMTFAHSLFRVMLAEQIYRAEGILHASPYHK